MSRSVNTGIPDEQLGEIAHGLSRVLTIPLRLTSKPQLPLERRRPDVYSLHAMFMGENRKLAPAVDEIAERTRAASVGPLNLATVRRVLGGSRGNRRAQCPRDGASASRTPRGHRTHSAKTCCSPKAPQTGSSDPLVRRLDVHEKTAWMLRSMLTWRPGVRSPHPTTAVLCHTKTRVGAQDFDLMGIEPKGHKRMA